jgi:hypothetical protein
MTLGVLITLIVGFVTAIGVANETAEDETTRRVALVVIGGVFALLAWLVR